MLDELWDDISRSHTQIYGLNSNLTVRSPLWMHMVSHAALMSVWHYQIVIEHKQPSISLQKRNSELYPIFILFPQLHFESPIFIIFILNLKPQMNFKFGKLLYVLGRLLRWPAMIPASSYLCHCVALSPPVRSGLNNIVAANTIWQRWCDLTFRISLQQVKISVLLADTVAGSMK